MRSPPPTRIHHRALTRDLRFYQRIALSFAVFYSIGLGAPFVRGVLAWGVSVTVLVLDVQ